MEKVKSEGNRSQMRIPFIHSILTLSQSAADRAKGEPELTSTDGAPGSNPRVLTMCGYTG